FINFAVTRRPLVSAIENLAIHVVLKLLRRAIPPPHRTRAAIAVKLRVIPFPRSPGAVEVVKRSWKPTALDRVQRPAEKSRRFLRAADAIERVDCERRVANPRVAVIPVAFATDHLS